MDQHGIQAPLLSLERQILLEEEVTTPPRGGAVRLPRLRCRQIFTEVRPRDGGPDQQMDVGSPVDVQQELANLRAEIRMSHWQPVINPVRNINQNGLPMEGTTYSEHPALGVSMDSRLRNELLYP